MILNKYKINKKKIIDKDIYLFLNILINLSNLKKKFNNNKKKKNNKNIPNLSNNLVSIISKAN
jgi:hypothetical protein